jgi:predicted CXXCH cytochrome family protein
MPLLIMCLMSASAAFAVAPHPAGEAIGWSHAPFESGACGICHENDDAANPGPITMSVNELCFECHDIFRETIESMEMLHPTVEDDCTGCHNPHNSLEPKLLDYGIVELCAQCHDDVTDMASGAAVKHAVVSDGAACLTCHDPHASNSEALLQARPYDLCVDCHGDDGMTDDDGVSMENLRTRIDTGLMAHGPVENHDCSACHLVHGGENFRMLVEDYPAKFYAPYEEDLYALCFSCHEVDVFNAAETTGLTGFRDGVQNLHYVHVNMDRRGRTCRACHEVHAAPHEHMIRKDVPYGKSGWRLQVNYERTPDGGTCAKTCHATKTYSRTASR